MALHWAPPDRRASAGTVRDGRYAFARFLTLSALVHVLAGVAVVWLMLSVPPARIGDDLVVRTIDFVEPAPGGARGGRGGRRPDDADGPPAPPSRAPRTAVAQPAAPVARRPESGRPAPSAERTAAVPPTAAASSPAQVAAAREAPAAPASPATSEPAPEDARLAAAAPRTIGRSAGAGREPAPVADPSAAATSSQTGVGGGVAGRAARDGERGPMATVSLPARLPKGKGDGTGGASGAGSAARGGGNSGAGAGVDLGDPDFSEYFRLIERRVRTAWTFPESLGGTTQTVKIGFALGPEGSLREARVISSSSGTLNDSALAAMKRAAPFPPLPEKFRGLAGQPLVMSFTVTIR